MKHFNFDRVVEALSWRYHIVVVVELLGEITDETLESSRVRVGQSYILKFTSESFRRESGRRRVDVAMTEVRPGTFGIHRGFVPPYDFHSSIRLDTFFDDRV
jgi:hypothetical protein